MNKKKILSSRCSQKRSKQAGNCVHCGPGGWIKVLCVVRIQEREREAGRDGFSVEINTKVNFKLSVNVRKWWEWFFKSLLAKKKKCTSQIFLYEMLTDILNSCPWGFTSVRTRRPHFSQLVPSPTWIPLEYLQ